MNGLLVPAVAVLVGAALVVGGIVTWTSAAVVGDYRRRRQSASSGSALRGTVGAAVATALFVAGHFVGGTRGTILIVGAAAATPLVVAFRAWWVRSRTPLQRQLLAPPAPDAPPVAAAPPTAAPDVTGPRRLRRGATAAFVLGGALIAASAFLLLQRPAWTGIERAEALSVPASDGAPASLDVQVWFHGTPPSTTTPWVWIELWSRHGKEQVVHAGFGPATGPSRVRQWSEGDLYDPSTKAYTRLPRGTEGQLSGTHAELHIPFEGLRPGITGWRVLTLTASSRGDMWPDVDAAPAPLAAPAARGGEGDIALGNARARVAAGVLSGHVDVTGAVPADARVIASITLTGPAATAELGTSLLVFEPSGSGWTLDQVTVPNAGAMHALRPPFARGIAATFDGQRLAFRVPAPTRGACCYRVSVVVSGPSGGGGRASLPALLTTPSLALAGHTVRQPTPGVAVGRTLVARHGALVRGVIALRRDPNAPAVGYIVRLLAPNGGVRGTFSVVFGRSGGGRRLPTTASAQIAQADGTTRTIDLLAAHVRGLSLSYAGGRSRFVVPLPGLRADACCWTASIGALDSSGSPRGGFVDTPARKLAR